MGRSVLRLSGILFIICSFWGCASFDRGVEERLSAGTHQAVINGAKLYYHVHGKGPVCIVHPGGPGFQWVYLRMPEVEQSLTLVYLEPVGSGQSERLHNPEDYTMRRYADDLEELRKQLGLEKFYLLGHSHGGMVAQVYAIEHQEHLRGLILYGTTPVANAEWTNDIMGNLKRYEKEPWFPDAVAAFASFPNVKTDEEGIALVKRAAGLYLGDYSAHRAQYDAYFSKVGISVTPYLTALKQEWPKFDVRPRLGEIKTPTLIINGEKDIIESPLFGREINSRIKDSRLEIIENAGHLAHFEEPTAFAATISGFVMDVEKTHGGK